VPLNFIPYDEKTKPLDKAEADRRIFRLTPGVPDSLAVDTEGVKSFLTQILKGMYDGDVSPEPITVPMDRGMIFIVPPEKLSVKEQDAICNALFAALDDCFAELSYGLFDADKLIRDDFKRVSLFDLIELTKAIPEQSLTPPATRFLVGTKDEGIDRAKVNQPIKQPEESGHQAGKRSARLRVRDEKKQIKPSLTDAFTKDGFGDLFWKGRVVNGFALNVAKKDIEGTKDTFRANAVAAPLGEGAPLYAFGKDTPLIWIPKEFHDYFEIPGTWRYLVETESGIVERPYPHPVRSKGTAAADRAAAAAGDEEKSDVKSGASPPAAAAQPPDAVSQDGAQPEAVANSESRDPNACFYRLQDGKLVTVTYRRWAKMLGRGGGGAMRADPINDAAYWWSGRQGAKPDEIRVLAKALGLDVNCMKAPKPTDNAHKFEITINPGGSVPVIGDMASEILYWKSFDAKPPRQKKNMPKRTKPIKPRLFRKATLSSPFSVKKQKGPWLDEKNGTRAAVRLAGEAGERQAASKVMSDFFEQSRRSEDLRRSVKDLVSASKFASYVISQSPQAKLAWDAHVLDVQSWDANKEPELDADGKVTQLRTQQEWCHLIGHGDGGPEVPENFVSGSNHCNTEQLAIESGERTARRLFKMALGEQSDGELIELEVKITAYLFPSSDSGRNESESDLKFLGEFNPDKIDRGKIGDQKYREEINKHIDDVKKYLYDRPSGSPSGPDDPFKALLSTKKVTAPPIIVKGELAVPTSDQYGAFNDVQKKRYAKNITERLYNVVVKPFPLGNFIRYKLLLVTGPKGAKTSKKIFDHVFDAQKESFDLNEFNILETTVRRIIADATGNSASYRAALKAKAARIDAKNKHDEKATPLAAQPPPPPPPPGDKPDGQGGRGPAAPGAGKVGAGDPASPAVLPPGNSGGTADNSKQTRSGEATADEKISGKPTSSSEFQKAEGQGGQAAAASPAPAAKAAAASPAPAADDGSARQPSADTGAVPRPAATASAAGGSAVPPAGDSGRAGGNRKQPRRSSEADNDADEKDSATRTGTGEAAAKRPRKDAADTGGDADAVMAADATDAGGDAPAAAAGGNADAKGDAAADRGPPPLKRTRTDTGASATALPGDAAAAAGDAKADGAGAARSGSGPAARKRKRDPASAGDGYPAGAGDGDDADGDDAMTDVNTREGNE
jgi:hypothetical protein